MARWLLLLCFSYELGAMEPNYTYTGFVQKVYDGDTCTVLINLGFSTYTKQSLRLANINTPEVRGDEKLEGIKVRDIVRELILNKQVVIKTYKDKRGKYGRYLADIYLDIDGDDQLDNLNDWLVVNNYATVYMRM